jgi:SOS response regulatory protein OraA/RecX
MKALSRRALAAAELVQRLSQKGFPAVVVAATMTRLRRLGMINEEELALAVCRGSLRTGHGRRAAVAAMRRRQLPADVIDGALAAVDDAAEDEALAAALSRATKRSPGWERDPAKRARVVRQLVAKGFPVGAVWRALRQAGDAGDTDTSA